MPEHGKIITACAVLLASLVAGTLAGAQTVRTQNAPVPPVSDLTVLKFAPARWWRDLAGEVREVETVEYRVETKDGRAVEARVNSQRVSFDRKGFETEAVDGEEGRMALSYDAEGRLSEMNMSLAGAPIAREVYSYDLPQRKVVTEAYAFGSARPRWRVVSTFDEKWNEVRAERETFTDDKSARAEKSVVIYKYVYDAKGRVIASTASDERGRISHKSTEEYGNNNRVAKSITYSYDEQSGQLLSKYVNIYDERGLVRSTLSYDPRGRLVRRETYTREFDRFGNWITQAMVAQETDSPGAFTYLKRRKIIYY